jgi:hypothetical protein
MEGARADVILSNALLVDAGYDSSLATYRRMLRDGLSLNFM